MTVIVARETPPAVRGLLKRWFIEPRPNVFVGTVNARIREKVIAYVRRNAPAMGMLVIARDNSTQGFTIAEYGEPVRRLARSSGLWLVAEKWEEPDHEDSETASC